MSRKFILVFGLLFILIFNMSAFGANTSSLGFDAIKSVTVNPSIIIAREPTVVTIEHGLIAGGFGVGITAVVDDSIIYDIPNGDLVFAYSRHSYSNAIYKSIIRNSYVKDALVGELGLGSSDEVTDAIIDNALETGVLGDIMDKKVVVQQFSISEKYSLKNLFLKGGLGLYTLKGTMRDEPTISKTTIGPLIGFGYGTSFSTVNVGFYYDYSFAKFNADFDYNGESESLGLGGHVIGLYLSVNL